MELELETWYSIVPNSSVPVIFTGNKWNNGTLEHWNHHWNTGNPIPYSGVPISNNMIGQMLIIYIIYFKVGSFGNFKCKFS
jgi:hypothetical protein